MRWAARGYPLGFEAALQDDFGFREAGDGFRTDRIGHEVDRDGNRAADDDALVGIRLPERVGPPDENPVPCCHPAFRQEVCHFQGKIVELPIGNHEPAYAGAVHEGGCVAPCFKCFEKIDQCLHGCPFESTTRIKVNRVPQLALLLANYFLLDISALC
jgi:hypothetical protein